MNLQTMTDFIDELITKYKLAKDSYYKESPYSEEARSPEEDLKARQRTKELKEKYKANVPPRWYGFGGLGAPTPLVWFDVLDELFEKLVSIYPKLEIYQVKVKFGSCRIYVGNIERADDLAIGKLEKVLADKLLIY